MSVNSLACPDTALLVAFARGRLPAELVDVIETHVTGCETCDLQLQRVQDASSVPPLPLLAASGADGYELLEEVGRGATAVVYRARETATGRTVAVKCFHATLEGTELQRFEREVRVMHQVKHPNLLRFERAVVVRGRQATVWEYADGGSLQGRLKQAGPLAVDKAVRLTAMLARAVAHLHDQRLIHRDLKPANILFVKSAAGGLVPKVADTGLIAVASDPTLTATGNPGTPAYMAPELLDSERREWSVASDVYALGAVLYETVAGKRPFVAPSLPQLVALIANGRPKPLAHHRPDIGPDLEDIVLTALDRAPQKRYRTMREFATALDGLSAGTLSRPPAPPRRRWRLPATLLALAVVAFLGGATVYVRTDHGTVRIDLLDPAASVTVTIDGQEVVIDDGGRVTRVRTGRHKLEVMAPGFKTVTESFAVTRGQEEVVKVTLAPVVPPRGSTPAPVTPAPSPVASMPSPVPKPLSPAPVPNPPAETGSDTPRVIAALGGTAEYDKGAAAYNAWLGGRALTDADFKRLAALGDLRGLGISECDVSPGGLTHLANYPGLYRLTLVRMPRFTADLSAVARNPALGEMQLQEMTVGRAALDAITQSPTINHIGLRGSTVADWAWLSRAVAMPKLQGLDVRQTTFGDAELRRVGGSPRIGGLHLSETRVTAAGLNQDLPPNLIILELGRLDLDDGAVADLARLTALRHLDLRGNPRLTTAALAALAAKLERLESLDVRGGKLTAADAAAIRNTRPGLKAVLVGPVEP